VSGHRKSGSGDDTTANWIYGARMLPLQQSRASFPPVDHHHRGFVMIHVFLCLIPTTIAPGLTRLTIYPLLGLATIWGPRSPADGKHNVLNCPHSQQVRAALRQIPTWEDSVKPRYIIENDDEQSSACAP